MKKIILLVPILLGGMLVSCGEEPKEIEKKDNNIKVNSYVKAEDATIKEELFLVDAKTQETYSSRIAETKINYFYSSIKDNNRIYREVIKNDNINNPKSEVSMLSGKDLIHNEGKMYYSNTQDEGKIYYFDESDFNEDIEAVALNISSSRDLVASTDGIFYINEDDNEKIYFVSYDGSIDKAVTQDRGAKFIVSDSVLYYQNASDGYNLYAINLLENKRYKLTDFSVESFTVVKGFVLATNSDDNNSLYFVKSNENIEKLSDRKSFELKSDLNKTEQNKNKFYYINESRELIEADMGEGMKIKLEKRISRDSVEDYYFTSDKIVIKDEEEVLKSYNK
ncbi:DUF5050 domain-containing protein [uncultured Clostridium sp.]|uniref:DUF5050 domain-containing protein n=1 Tax=uncultured Clostridium sp. TaxID=59620 RepID=UPI002613B700|nr:DUF5050 domain-containing protein [uncultured Clostridium sp.]